MFELMDSHSKDPTIKVIGVGGGGGGGGGDPPAVLLLLLLQPAMNRAAAIAVAPVLNRVSVRQACGPIICHIPGKSTDADYHTRRDGRV